MFVLFQFHINCPTSSPPLSLSRCVLGCKEVQHCREAPGMQSGNNIKAHNQKGHELHSCLLNLVERVRGLHSNHSETNITHKES